MPLGSGRHYSGVSKRVRRVRSAGFVGHAVNIVCREWSVDTMYTCTQCVPAVADTVRML